MTRLLVHVEGQTEEEFVNTILAPHLYAIGFTSVQARMLGAARSRKRRGGICPWDVVRTEIHRHLANDTEAYATSIVDYYGMPANDWPGRVAAAGQVSIQNKATTIHNALRQDFLNHHGAVANRFIPYVAMHEFEALLFSHAVNMSIGMGMPQLAASFSVIRQAYATPEHINDSPSAFRMAMPPYTDLARYYMP